MLSAVSWTGSGDGTNWTDPNNWSGHAVPGQADDVTIDIAAGTTIELLAQNRQFVHGLVSNAPLKINGMLDVATTAQLSANLTLAGSIHNGTYQFSGGAQLVIGGTKASPAALNLVTLSGNIDATNPSADFIIENGLALNGTIFLGDSAGNFPAELDLGDSTAPGGTLGGTGSIVLGGSVGNAIVNAASGSFDQTVTIGPDVTIRGKAGTVSNLPDSNPQVPDTRRIINQGTIDVDTAGGSVQLPDLVNDGSVEAANGGSITAGLLTNDLGGLISITGSALAVTGMLDSRGSVQATGGASLAITGLVNEPGATLSVDASTLTLNGGISNQGTITATNSTVVLAGDFAQADLGTFIRSGGTVKVSGTVHGDITLDAGTGAWDLEGATLDGGTVHENGAPLVFGPAGTTLIDPTFNGDIDLSQFPEANLTVIGTLTLNGTLLLGNASGTTFGTVRFGPGAQRFVDSAALGAEAGGYQPISQFYLGNAALLGHATVVLGGRQGVGNSLINNTLIFRGAPGTDDDPVPPAFILPGANNSIFYVKGGHLTLGPDVVIRGGSGSLFNEFNEATIDNNGAIVADGNTSALLIGGGGGIVGVQSNFFNNIGSVQAINGGTVSIDGLVNTGTVAANAAGLALTGSLDNQGTITATNSLVDLKATLFTQAQLGTFINSGSTVQLSGAIKDGLTLDASTGSWILHGGTVTGGTLTENAGSHLLISSGTLNSVTVNGDLDVDQFVGATVQIFNSLVLNGTMFVGNLPGTVTAEVFVGGRSAPDTRITGNGSIVFGGNDSLINQGGLGTTPAVLTIGPGITVRGKVAFIHNADAIDQIINQGTIDADTAGGRLTLGDGIGGIINQGTIRASNGGTLPIFNLSNSAGKTVGATGGSTLTFNGVWNNDGAISSDQSTVNLGGTFTQGNLGAFARSGGTVNLTGTLTGGLALNAGTGSWVLAGGTILGGALNETDGATLVLSSGTFSGVTVNGDIDGASSPSAQVTVLGGLVLNGTLSLGNAAGTTSAGVTFGTFNSAAGALSGNGTVVFGGNQNSIHNESTLGGPAGTLTIGPAILIRGKTGLLINDAATGSIVNQGTIRADTAGGTIQLALTQGTFVNQGDVEAVGGTAQFGNVVLAGQGLLQSDPPGSFTFGGSVSGDSTAVAASDPRGSVTLNQSSSPTNPQLIEAMSADDGNTAAGFSHNFAYGKLTIAGNNVKLVDQFDNAAGSGAEAVYADALVVLGTLDLNGLHVYARAAQLDGTVLNGTVTVLPDGGALPLNTLVSGTITPAGNVDDWTFLGRAGDLITAFVDPGANSTPSAVAPNLVLAAVQLLAPDQQVLASGSSGGLGAAVTLANVALPADGTYTVSVASPSDRSTLVGNYLVGAFDVTPRTAALNLGQQVSGSIRSAFDVQKWTFSAPAGEQVRFHLVNEASAGLVYSLTGPNGQAVFTNLAGDSALLDLPSTGTYTLDAQGRNGATGSYSFVLASTSVIDVPLNGSANGAFAGSGSAQLFKVSLPAVQSLLLELHDSSRVDTTEVYARFGEAPTRESYDFRASSPSTPDQTLLVPDAASGTWYVLVYGSNVPVAGPFNLSASASSGLHALSLTPAAEGNAAPEAVRVTGTGFEPGSTVALTGPGGQQAASSVQIVSDGELTATFPAGLPAGTYSLTVSHGGFSDTLANALMITTGGSPHLQTDLTVPSALGRHVGGTLYVSYSNAGTVAMPAPLLILSSDDPVIRPLMTLDASKAGRGFGTSSIPSGYSNTIEILGGGAVAGMLLPGESITVPVYWGGLQQPWDFTHTDFPVTLNAVEADDPTPIDWNGLKASLKPGDVPQAAWDRLYPNLTAPLGATQGQYVAALDTDAAYLGGLGEHATDPASIWYFMYLQADDALGPADVPSSAVDASLPLPGRETLAFSRAYHLPLAARDTLGVLGYGWTSSFDSSIGVEADGTLDLSAGAGGQIERFDPDSRGGYLSPDQHLGVARNPDGSYTLLKSDGSSAGYTAGGRLAYEQDQNGNRLTMSYDGAGRLVGVAASSGPSLTFAYNAAGRLASVSDSVGRVTTYAYDPTNQYLLSATDTAGTTSYTYYPAANALASIARADGTHAFYSYDAQGRLAGVSADGGIGAVSFAYTAPGEVSATDAMGTLSKTDYNEFGLPVKLVDGLGNVVHASYDLQGNVVAVTDSDGGVTSYTYDMAGNLTGITDALHATDTFTYDQNNRLASFTDPNHQVTRYSYDGNGNLRDITYADANLQSFTYDPAGDAISFVNRNGLTTGYTRDAYGLVTHETFADGSHYDYAYDAHENLISATDATGATSFTYDPGDRLTGVSYPGGRSLTFTYDAGGRRIKMVDQSGYTINYAYTAAGELAGLTDGNDQPIVTYTYDAAGRLVRQDNANGTFTTHEYDAAGRLLHLVNSAPDGAVNSRFDYSYDASSELTGVSSLDGAWAYTYDADGQLVHAVFTSVNPAVPNQDLAYSYDPAGNRISTVENGVATSYGVNQVNEYTSVGGVPFRYDADGNLLSDGTSTYTYDQLDELTSVTNAQGTTRYVYDALGQRVASIADGQTTQDLIDPVGFGNVVARYDGAGSLLAHFNYGLALVNQVAGDGATYFYDFDHTGSTLGLTDSGGRYQTTYRYLPFGQNEIVTGAVSNPFGYGGLGGVQTDPTGLVFMRARYDDPQVGRFISGDPVQLAGGDSNFYRYVHNQPIQFADPSGLDDMTWGEFLQQQSLLARRDSLPSAHQPLSQEEQLDQELENEALAAWDNIGVDPDSLLGRRNALTSARQKTPEQLEQERQEQLDLLRRRDALISARISDAELRQQQELQDFLDWRRREKEFQRYLHPVPQIHPSDLSIRLHELSKLIDSTDPNDKLGPGGFGPSNFVADGGAFPYRVDFENAESATAPAQEVVVTDQLSPNLVWGTFRLSEIGWGDVLITVPPDSQHFQTTVSMTESGRTFDVHVEAGIDLGTGLVTARFDSIDPLTSLPPDVLTGFLPPENGTGRGQGHFTYFVAPKAGLPTGTVIRNIAAVSFDGQPIITTNQADDEDPGKGTDAAKEALVTIDSAAPTGGVTPLPATQTSPSFIVTWAGQDDAGGAGIASYDVFVSDNGGPFAGWLTNTTATAGTYPGAAGHTYGFYSIAIDNVGNAQPTPASAQATTRVVAPLTGDVNGDGTVNFSDLLILAQHYGRPGVFADGDLNGDGTIGFADLLILAQNYGKSAAAPGNPLALPAALRIPWKTRSRLARLTFYRQACLGDGCW